MPRVPRLVLTLLGVATALTACVHSQESAVLDCWNIDQRELAPGGMEILCPDTFARNTVVLLPPPPPPAPINTPNGSDGVSPASAGEAEGNGQAGASNGGGVGDAAGGVGGVGDAAGGVGGGVGGDGGAGGGGGGVGGGGVGGVL